MGAENRAALPQLLLRLVDRKVPFALRPTRAGRGSDRWSVGVVVSGRCVGRIAHAGNYPDALDACRLFARHLEGVEVRR